MCMKLEILAKDADYKERKSVVQRKKAKLIASSSKE